MRILIAEPHHQVRWALLTIIQEQPEIILVGEAKDSETLLDEAKRTDPDLVMLSWALPGQSGPDHLASLRTLHRRPKVIVLGSKLENEEMVLEVDTEVFVETGSPPNQLFNALQAMQKTVDSAGSGKADKGTVQS